MSKGYCLSVLDVEQVKREGEFSSVADERNLKEVSEHVGWSGAVHVRGASGDNQRIARSLMATLVHPFLSAYQTGEPCDISHLIVIVGATAALRAIHRRYLWPRAAT